MPAATLARRLRFSCAASITCTTDLAASAFIFIIFAATAICTSAALAPIKADASAVTSITHAPARSARLDNRVDLGSGPQTIDRRLLRVRDQAVEVVVVRGCKRINRSLALLDEFRGHLGALIPPRLYILPGRGPLNPIELLADAVHHPNVPPGR